MRRLILFSFVMLLPSGGPEFFAAEPQIVSRSAPPSSSETASSREVFDVDAQGVPKFVNVDYLELAKVAAISKFRSAVGHDYSDSFETCRSMKHYFKFKDQLDWSTVQIASPVSGVVFRTQEEWAGTKIELRSKEWPAFTFAIFHVKLAKPLKAGDEVTAGQALGTHIGSQTFSDVAVSVQTPKGRKLISYFEVITEDLFHRYQARGLASRDLLLITKEVRDAEPLTCEQSKFTTQGKTENWVTLP